MLCSNSCSDYVYFHVLEQQQSHVTGDDSNVQMLLLHCNEWKETVYVLYSVQSKTRDKCTGSKPTVCTYCKANIPCKTKRRASCSTLALILTTTSSITKSSDWVFHPDPSPCDSHSQSAVWWGGVLRELSLRFKKSESCEERRSQNSLYVRKYVDRASFTGLTPFIFYWQDIYSLTCSVFKNSTPWTRLLSRHGHTSL